jgi:hypothetical protein
MPSSRIACAASGHTFSAGSAPDETALANSRYARALMHAADLYEPAALCAQAKTYMRNQPPPPSTLAG